MIKTIIEIYDRQRELNIKLQKKVPEMNQFFFPTWHGLLPEIRREHIDFFKYLVKNHIFHFRSAEKHAQSVINRLSAGWRLGGKRNNIEKIDPFLIEFEMCPDWFQEWGLEKDRILCQTIQKFHTY